VNGVDADYISFAAMFARMGLPQPVIKGLISFYSASGDHEYAGVSSHIESVTGRPATKTAGSYSSGIRKYLKIFGVLCLGRTHILKAYHD